MIALIVAMAENGVIGRDNTLPWHISDDLKNFRRLTSGHPILMGRKTYESIGRPLPKRRNIIISRSGFTAEGCESFPSIESAVEAVSGEELAFIIGGAQIYSKCLNFADKLYVTRVHAEVEGDAFFPEIGPEWQLVEEASFAADEKNDHPFSFQTYERR